MVCKASKGTLIWQTASVHRSFGFKWGELSATVRDVDCGLTRTCMVKVQRLSVFAPSQNTIVYTAAAEKRFRNSATCALREKILRVHVTLRKLSGLGTG